MASPTFPGIPSAALPQPPPKSSGDIWKNLKEWIEQDGGAIHAALALSGNGPSRGVIANEPILKGELLIRVMPTSVVSGASVAATWQSPNEAAASATEPSKHASPWLRCVAAYIQSCTTNNEPSKDTQHSQRFEPYLNSLPQDAYESILQWTVEELQQFLRGTTLGVIALADRKDGALQQRYQNGVRPFLRHLGLVADGESPSKEEMETFVDACMCISTRGFHCSARVASPSMQEPTAATTVQRASSAASSSAVATTTTTAVQPPISTTYDGPFLLPAIDLLNHNPSKSSTTLRMDEGGSFFMTAERDIAQNEEVYHSYGQSLTSAQMLQTFGFIPHDSIQKQMVERCGRSLTTQCSQDMTMATFFKSKIIEACQSVANSDYPERLQKQLQSGDDETWDVANLPTRILDDILPDTIALSHASILGEDLITLIALQFLPNDIYQELFRGDPTLLDHTILEDCYLGHLVCQALREAIDWKCRTYIAEERATPAPACIEVFQQLQKELVDHGNAKSNHYRGMYGTAIRLEEVRGLMILRERVDAIEEHLDNQLSIVPLFEVMDGTDDHPTKRQRLD